MSVDPLASARGTVNHAKEHIDEIAALEQSFFDADPYEIVTEPDPNPAYPGYHIQYLRLAKPLPHRINGLASDAVKNLRAALDHLGFAVACASGKSGKKAHFPFADSRVDLETRRPDNTKHIPKEIFTLMVAFRPYQGGNETLWRLNKLANTNKHEVTVGSIFYADALTYKGPGFELRTGPRGSAQDQIQIAWLPPGKTKAYDELKVSAAIRFNDVGALAFEEPAVRFLSESARIVERIIVRVEAEARRLRIL
jgi:hypothetical protein